MKKRLDANCSNYKVINEIVVCDSTKQCEKYKEFIKMQKKELDDLVHKSEKKNIIFVSNDVKEDIYDKKNNCICFSLQKWFYDETGYKIVMMKNDEFNNFCNKIIKDKDEQINKTTKDELKSFSSFSMNQNITLTYLKYLNALNTLNDLNNSLKELKDSTKNLSEIDNLKKLNDSISFFQQYQNNLRNISDALDNSDKS